MDAQRALAGVGVVVALVPAALGAAVAVLATRPRLAAKVFGGVDNPGKSPADFGLPSVDVEYATGCPAWWIPVDGSKAAVVIVHGFETSEDPRSTDPGPRLELAAMLAEEGFSSLVISLGYGSGAHLHSGGPLEAADVAAAVRWAASESAQRVAVIGFSAGGHAAVAASNDCNVFAVLTDSSFVDFSEVAQNQGAALLGAPPWIFGLVPRFMELATGHAPISLEASGIDRSVPMLHIHGDADLAIAYDNQARLARVTGGQTVTFASAGHVDSLRVDGNRYKRIVVDFLERSHARREAAAEH